jgi:hypothetical protein
MLYFIRQSNLSDDISDGIEDLKRKFKLFAFLVDCGLDPGEQMAFLPANICRILSLACSSPPNISAQCADMLRCLVARSSSNPFDFSRKYVTSIVLALLDIVPEIASCITNEESWPLPELLAEQDYGNRRNGYSWSEYPFPEIEENAYRLLHDPTAIYVRERLKWKVPGPYSRPDMADACLNVLRQSQYLPDYESGAWDMAVKARLVAFLESGMSPKDITILRGMPGSVAQYYMVHGKKHLLESALLLVGWTPDSIRVTFEEEASALLVRFLDSLKPVTATSETGSDLFDEKFNPSSPDQPSKAEIFYLKNRNMALNEGYRRYFPEVEEEEKILRVVNKYDRLIPIYDLPAVNGITQDFWD